MEQIFSKKWFYTGLIIAIFTPFFSGLILGAMYLTEPGLKKYGPNILPISVVWGALAFWVSTKYLPVSVI